MKREVLQTGLALVMAGTFAGGCGHIKEALDNPLAENHDSGQFPGRDGSIGAQGMPETGGITIIKATRPSPELAQPKGVNKGNPDDPNSYPKGTKMMGANLGPEVIPTFVESASGDALDPLKFGENVVWFCARVNSSSDSAPAAAELQFKRANTSGKITDDRLYRAATAFDLAVEIQDGDYKWLGDCDNSASTRGEIFPENGQNGDLDKSEIPSGK